VAKPTTTSSPPFETALTASDDHRRHQLFDPLVARENDANPDDRVNEACSNNSAQGNSDIGIGPFSRISRGNDNDRDKRAARTEIARHSSADSQQIDQRSNSRTKQRHVGIEAHEKGHQYCAAEHGHDVLNAHERCLGGGQPLLGQDQPFGLEFPARTQPIEMHLLSPRFQIPRRDVRSRSAMA
jgi:hypothetical protein